MRSDGGSHALVFHSDGGAVSHVQLGRRQAIITPQKADDSEWRAEDVSVH